MRIKNFIFKHKWWLVSGALLIFILITVFGGNSNDNIEAVTVEPKSFVRNVSVAGKVIPAEEVELGFDRGGRVTVVNKGVGETVYAGETIALISSGDASADLAKAEADLMAEKARLEELKTGVSSSYGTELDIRNKELKEALAEAYTISDDAIHNKVDQFFNERNRISFAFADYDLKQEIDKERREIGYMLDKWSEDRTNVTTAETNLAIIKSFLEKVALAVNDFKEDGSAFTQTEIDKFKTDVSSARTSVNGAISNITDAKENIRASESEIPYQEAKVRSAEANVARLRSDLGKNVITAPFSGTITIQDAKVGQIVGVNQVVTKLISNRAFQIETFVPEINIGEIMVGNIAKVTLDAYGSDQVFEAKVISIEPAETIRDGVSTYKTKFEFMVEDERLRSGMTANVVITTDEKTNAIVISQDSVINRGGFQYVKVIVGEEIVEKQVTLGSVSSTGEVEVISGLSAGEKVVLKPDAISQ